MTRCKVSELQLMAWIDGEAGADAERIEKHVQDCATCEMRAAAWKSGWAKSKEYLARTVDKGAEGIEPLVALQGVRQRIATHRESSKLVRLRTGWQELIAFHKRAVAGVGMAAALGALCAPGLVYWAGMQGANGSGNQGASLASVVIESLEYQGEATAVVYQATGSTTTLIWMEPSDDAQENF